MVQTDVTARGYEVSHPSVRTVTRQILFTYVHHDTVAKVKTKKRTTSKAQPNHTDHEDTRTSTSREDEKT